MPPDRTSVSIAVQATWSLEQTFDCSSFVKYPTVTLLPQKPFRSSVNQYLIVT